MSVAFRRESDEEHKEPRFELPIPPGPNLVTPKGPALLAARVAEIEAAVAAAETEEAREALRRDLRYWHTRATTAQIAPTPEPEVVGIGSRVRIRLSGKARTIDIVGHDEADPAADRIAYAAPLANALLGAESGERIDFNGRVEAIEVVDIATIPD